jgi:hypothetical protein
MEGVKKHAEKGGDVFALKHYGSVSNAISGVVKELKSDRNFENSINAIINRLDP